MQCVRCSTRADQCTCRLKAGTIASTKDVRVTFRTMTCRRCGHVWDPVPLPADVQRVINEHKETCK